MLIDSERGTEAECRAEDEAIERAEREARGEYVEPDDGTFTLELPHAPPVQPATESHRGRTG